MTDDLGRRVTVPVPLHRIVSLAPNLTEIVYALGADSSLVGVTDYCDYPPQAARKPRMGGMINPNIEAVVAARPDLVLMSAEGNSRLDFEKLINLHVPVFATNPRTIDGVFKSIGDIAGLTGTTARATVLLHDLRSRRDSIVGLYRNGLHPRTLVVISLAPLMVAGNGSFVDEMIADAGGINVGRTGTGSYPLLSREEILRARPDCIILGSDIAIPVDQLLREYPEWKTLDAVKNGRVYSIDASIISRPGPRVIEGLEKLAELIHKSP